MRAAASTRQKKHSILLSAKYNIRFELVGNKDKPVFTKNNKTIFITRNLETLESLERSTRKITEQMFQLVLPI